MLEHDPMVTVKYPFRGDKWKHGYPVFADSVAGVTRLGGDKTIKLSISGRGFSRDTQVILDRNYVTDTADVTETLIIVDIEASTLANYKKLIVKGRGQPVVIDIPDGTPPPQVAKIDAGQKLQVRKDTSVGVTLTGSALMAITSAKFDGKSLPTQVQENGKKLLIFLSREVTARTGEAVILLETAEGLVPVTVIVEA